MTMRLYIDTADVSVWEEWMPSGMFYGVTCNPLLLERANVPCTLDSITELTRRAVDLGANEIHAQTWGSSADEMIRNGLQLAKIDPAVLVKVPITQEGVFAAGRLRAEGARLTITAVYAAHQIVTSMALDAEYSAPYLGRMDEGGRDGNATVVRMQRMIANTGSDMRLIVASLRNISDVAALTEAGIKTFTLSPALLPQLFADASTNAAAEDFERAARAMQAV